MAEVQVTLSEEDLAALKALAERSGVSPTTALQQAIANAKVISDNLGEKDDLLIKKGDKFLKVHIK